MSWTALVPLKDGHERKSRLAPRLTPAARAALGDRMAAHVLACLRACPSIDRILLLSSMPGTAEGVGWARDAGRGLNAEIAAARDGLGTPQLLVIHGDLPLVAPEDVEALLAAAGSGGCALAPDRHGAGTNALALAGAAPFGFAFGPGSLARHQAAAGGAAIIVRRPGLSIDIDTPDDLDAAVAAGFALAG